MNVRPSSPVPAFQKNNVPIVLASSAEYVPYLAATIQSIVQTSTTKNCYDILLLHKEIGLADQRSILQLSKDHSNISIRFVRPDNAVIDNDFNFREDAAAASESFYCVLLKDILPTYKKVICMDCDVIVLHDLADLYATDIKGYLIAAARDPDGIGNCYADASGVFKRGDIMRGRAAYMLETLGLRRLEDYFQSGIMLLNLEEFRKQYTTEQLLEVACADYIQWGDQDTMNLLCKDKVYYLDMAWNLIVNWHDLQLGKLRHYGPKEILEEYETARKAPRIIHYAGTKPWKVFDADLFPYFWEAAIKTPYYKQILDRLVEAQGMSGTERDEVGRQNVLEQYRDQRLGLRYMSKFLKAWWEGKQNGKTLREQNGGSDTFPHKEVEKQRQSFGTKAIISGNGNDPIISVIIPCHNVEKYLKACVDSILHQSISNVEILLIDNVSSDKTSGIIREYEDKYPNVKMFFLTEDLGPAGARNKGIEMATGKYIAFCDADDTVPPNAYEMLLQKAETTLADMVVGQFNRLYPDGHFDIDKLTGDTPFEKCVNCAVVWNKLFYASFLKNSLVRFDMKSTKARYGEDLLFVCQLLLTDPHIETLEEVVYNHLEVRPEKIRASQLTGEKMMWERFYAYTYVVTTIFSNKPTHHLAAWRKFYIKEIIGCYHNWGILADKESREKGFSRLQELVEFGEEKEICDWNDLEAGNAFQEVFKVNVFAFQVMTVESYMLFLSIHNLRFQPSQKDLHGENVPEHFQREETLRMFREGKIGFRYIWKYFKAWLHFKLCRSLN